MIIVNVSGTRPADGYLAFETGQRDRTGSWRCKVCCNRFQRKQSNESCSLYKDKK